MALETQAVFVPSQDFDSKRARRTGLDALQRAFPDFDFANLRNVGFMRGSRAGADEVRLLGDGRRRISVTRTAAGELRVQYTDSAGHGRMVEVTAAIRSELAQAFRLAAIRERTEALARLQKSPKVLSTMSIESDFLDGLAWAARITGGAPVA